MRQLTGGDEVLLPRDSARWIADRSTDVKICQEGIKKTAQLIEDGVTGPEPSISLDRWKEHELNPKTTDKAAIDWIFLCDTLNFSFWTAPGTEKYTVNYGGQCWTGYWSLCAAINRAMDEGIPITDPKYYSTLSEETLAAIFRSDTATVMPLLKERLAALHEAGQVLVEKYDGSFVNMMKKSNKSAITLLQMVVAEFSSYRDEADYMDKRVACYKRAQILIADVWACCEGQGLGAFNDIDSITMFADYRIPQVLVWLGALQYSDTLNETLAKGTMFDSGDRLEVEIRGCSIWAVELIVEEVRKSLTSKKLDPAVMVNAILVDHYLWDYRRDHAAETDHIPIHKIRCIYY